MKKTLAIAAILILGLFLSASPDAKDLRALDINTDSFKAVSAAFSPTPMVGHFTQVKSLKGTSRSFKSSGRVQIAPGKGIVWYTEKPYASILIIGRDYLTQQIRSGKPSHLAIADNRIFVEIASNSRLSYI